ncbi:hypothetical protein H696_01132 [Fonticula alba]|uniref:Uncharacterized protein n=1 Tax=Fonticula alba TaxID=691883 RepID=A0A058ZBD2_FONAL|nr:hypothetical protein H696_01132 [Fonticula alba]KCV71709.1 hypothetical protein H696_01132 [Fonticula alba]|eukprot:XP_009493287.1 hypothetical protein H696_01132 [Fonticula alba]
MSSPPTDNKAVTADETLSPEEYSKLLERANAALANQLSAAKTSVPAPPVGPCIDADLYVDGAPNPTALKCQYCNSSMLDAKAGTVRKTKIDLPAPEMLDAQGKSKLNPEDFPPEELELFLEVDSIFTFLNMGFAHAVQGRKYMCCADCNFGPVGFLNTTTNRCWLARDRVTVRQKK